MTNNAARLVVSDYYYLIWEQIDVKPAVQVQLKGRNKLVDVNLKLLEIVANRWKGRNFCLETDVESLRELVVAVTVGEVYSGKTPLLVTINEQKSLSRLEVWLIKRAFKFRRAGPETSQYDQNHISTYARQVADAIKSDRLDVFLLSLDTLIISHQALLSVGETQDDEGRPSNFASMGGDYSAPKNEWLREYSRIFEAAVAMLETDREYFGRACYVAHRLSSHILTYNPSSDSLYEVIIKPTNLHFYLNDLWQKSYGASANMNNPLAIKADENPAYETYEKAFYQFMYSWKSLMHRVQTDKADIIDQWDRSAALFNGYEAHLHGTILEAARAIRSGNEIAAQKWIDFLLKWPDLAQDFGEDSINLMTEFSDRQKILSNKSLLGKPWSEVEDILFPEGAENRNVVILNRRSLFDAIRINYWHDANMTLAAFLLEWSHEDNQNLASTSLTQLLESDAGPIPVFDYNISTVYLSAVRSYANGLRFHSSAGGLSRLVETLRILAEDSPPKLDVTVTRVYMQNYEILKRTLQLIIARIPYPNPQSSKPALWQPENLESLIEADEVSGDQHQIHRTLENMERLDCDDASSLMKILRPTREFDEAKHIYEIFLQNIENLREALGYQTDASQQQDPQDEPSQ